MSQPVPDIKLAFAELFIEVLSEEQRHRLFKEPAITEMPDTTDFKKGLHERKRDAKASEKSFSKSSSVWEDIDHIKFV